MNQIIAVALGGSLGAVLRFWVAGGIYEALGRSFPHGTLFVNVTGSFLMGFLTELFLQRFPLSSEYRAAILVGFLGAFTTYSTFAIETLYLFEEGAHLKAGLNVLLSVVLCLAAVWFGVVVGRRVFLVEGPGVLPANFPWSVLIISLMLPFLLGLSAEVAAAKLQFMDRLKTGITLFSLGLIVTTTTIYYALCMPEMSKGYSMAVTLFGLQALVCTLALWTGSVLGRHL